MTAMADEQPTKKKAGKKAAPADPVLHVVEPPKPKPKPGEKGFDWAREYPGEEIYIYTVPDTATKSPAGLTIGLAKLTPDRAPKPGRLREYHREGGMSVMWYFIEIASSPASLRLQSELDQDEYAAMVRGYADFAGIELGDS